MSWNRSSLWSGKIALVELINLTRGDDLQSDFTVSPTEVCCIMQLVRSLNVHSHCITDGLIWTIKPRLPCGVDCKHCYWHIAWKWEKKKTSLWSRVKFTSCSFELSGFFLFVFFFCAEVEDCVMEKTRWQWEEVPGSVLNGRQVLIAHIDAGCWWWLVECEEERWLSKTGVVFRRHEIHHLVDGTWKESWKQTALQKHQPIMCKSNLQKDIWKNLSDFCFGLHISHRPVHQSVGTVV